MPAHRLWRIDLLTSVKGSGNLSGVAMRQAAGEPTQTGGGIAIAGSSYPWTNPQGAVSGNPNDLWRSLGNLPDWWGYDFGGPTIVTQIGITANAATKDYCPLTFNVDWSDDGVAWTHYRSFTTGVWTAGVEKIFQLDPDDFTPAAYARVTQHAVQLLVTSDSNVRVTQAALQVVTFAPSNLRVTQAALIVVRGTPPVSTIGGPPMVMELG